MSSEAVTARGPGILQALPRLGLYGTGLILLALSVLSAVGLGAVQIPLETVASIFVHKLWPDVLEVTWSRGRENIIWEIRFPRAILAALVGAGLGMVGAALQAVTRNPLADPHLLGISSGAAFGAILALLHTGLFLGLATVPLFAFLGALAATGIVVTVSRLTEAISVGRLVLAGVAVSFVIMALANFLIFLGDPKATHTVVFWLLGGLGLAQWSYLLYPLVALLLCGAYLQAHAGALNAMTVGDETATTLGISVRRFRISVFVCTALLTGVLVAFSGTIGFVGLMIPHIVRFIIGGDNARVLPLSALTGAIFLVWADVFSRLVMAPEDMPIGILTGFVGGLFFIFVLGRRKA